jgi:hypothetical protein
MRGQGVRSALNLLHHPTLAWQQKWFHLIWTGLTGLLVGMASAWGALLWQASETDDLRQMQTRLQDSLNQQAQSAQEAQQRQRQARLQSGQLAQLARVDQHQQAWLRLHKGLQMHLQRQGVKLERLQFDGPNMALHGHSAQMSAITAGQKALSQDSQGPWVLSSLLVEADQLQFVWQGPGPEALTLAQTAVSNRPRITGAAP